MASLPEKPHHLPTPFSTTTAAPPPTPSTHPNLPPQPTTPDFLSHLLHRLPPTLSHSLPTRRSTTTTTAPVISLSAPTPTPSLLSASTEHGFFHLTHHSIPAHLPLAAESAALSLFNLPHHQKQHLFPNNWPLGHDVDDDNTESFCFDSSISTADSTQGLDLDALRAFARELEKLGMDILEKVCSAAGFNSPARNDLCTLLWVSDGVSNPGRVYPYAVALHYQVRGQRMSLLSDSGRVSVLGQADSVFVTLGDIAQVWSNGKLKKVRGRAFPSDDDDSDTMNSSSSHKMITMSLLITLSVESIICPLLPDLLLAAIDDDDENEEDSSTNNKRRLFDSFSFEDYAWRVYHQTLLHKDPLVRYRVS